MKIQIFDEYDGFEIIVDGKSFRFSQDDEEVSLLTTVFKVACPGAEITYEEVY